jgi:hypothetical protein
LQGMISLNGWLCRSTWTVGSLIWKWWDHLEVAQKHWKQPLFFYQIGLKASSWCSPSPLQVTPRAKNKILSFISEKEKYWVHYGWIKLLIFLKVI